MKRFAGDKFDMARDLFDKITTDDDFAEFLTLPGYEIPGSARDCVLVSATRRNGLPGDDPQRKSRDGEVAIASTRVACAPVRTCRE